MEGRFRPARGEVSRARRLIATALADWRMAADLPAVELIVSEMLAEAVRRGAAEIDLHLDASDDTLRIEVHEPAFPVSDAGPLWFVDGVAVDWGRQQLGDRVVTWATCRRAAGMDVADGPADHGPAAHRAAVTTGTTATASPATARRPR